MIIRVVKMTFQEGKITDFLETFNTYKQYIRNREGCTHLELWNDINSPGIYFTYSHWQSEADLNNYRNSELFDEVWSKTKILFAAKAEAWSVNQQIV